MTLTELAEALAQRMNCQVEPSDNPYEVTVQGKGYHFKVASFFGGWQATLYIPGQAPVTYYGEAVEALELRLKGKLTGRPVD